MPPHPTSPSSLLWAHQLKLEHTHLLSRLTTLQTVTASLSTGLTSATATSDRVTRLESSATNLGARVAAIEEDDKDVKEWIERLDDAQRARTREEGLKVERLGRKVGEVLVREKEWGRLEGIVLGLGRRVEELERGVKGEREREREREKGLSRKNDPDDVKVLARRLDAVEAGRGEVVRKAEELRERVEGLEKGKWEWENEKWRLGRKVETREKALETRDRLSQAVPDSERTTQVDLETVPFPSSTQDIPEAIMETIERSSSDIGTQLPENSPAFSASLRRSVRIAPRYTGEPSFQPAQLVDQPSLESWDVAFTQKQPGAANSRKKRQAAPTQDASQKKNQSKNKAKAVKEKLIAIKPSQQQPAIEPKTAIVSDPQPTLISGPRSNIISGPPMAAPVPAERPRKRKRREIPQEVDLETFAAMAGI